MMSASSIRLWCQVHKWTSLITTAFMLLLCITGLPLIFYHEIDHALGNAIEAPPMPAGIPAASLDAVTSASRAFMPGTHIQFVSWDPDKPDQVFASMARAPDAPSDENRFLVLDARTAKVLGEWPFQGTFMFYMYRLHVDMFAGLPGKLFLGLMGLFLVVAVISGVVVYGPFMRRLDFGTVRKRRSRRLLWLDLHNLLGIVTVAWVLVVGLTGVINTWADLVFKYWQAGQLAEMVAPYKGQPPVHQPGSLQTAMDTARRAAPGMTPSFVAFPQTGYSSQHHYAIFMRGETPLTSRLLKPVLIDAANGAFTDSREAPWYMTALLLSQPLHFGDYGQLPLKIIWALLDAITIVVLGSGLYLWLARRKAPLEQRVAELSGAAQLGAE